MSKLATRPFCEPEENEFAARDEAPSVERNAALYAGLLKGLLDQIDDAMGRAIEHGLEAELRAIVAKHLPPPPALPPRGTPERTDRLIADADRAPHLAWGIDTLRRYGRRLAQGNAAGRATVETCVRVLVAALREPAPAADHTKRTTP